MIQKLLNVRLIVLFVLIFSGASRCSSHPPPRSDKETLEPETASIFTPRPLVTARKMMVSSAHPLASQAGLEILKSGGNALDAAIAVQMVLNVVEPQSSGIGGGGFLLFFDAKTGELIAYDGRETAPAGIRPDAFLDENGKPREFFDAVVGGQSVGVPGVVKMLELAHKEKGQLDWKKLFKPAIQIARMGFPISPRLHHSIQTSPHLNTFAAARRYLFQEDGKTPKSVGTLLKNPELADTFAHIAQGGATSFYAGAIARDIVKTVRGASRNPGAISEEDLLRYEAKKRAPICLFYRVYEICSIRPPSSGGIAVLQMMGILENFDLTQLKPESADFLHLLAQANKLAFADRNLYVADEDFVDVPTEELIAESYLKKRSDLIARERDQGDFPAGEPIKKAAEFAPGFSSERPSTSHLVVADQDGNVVSFTSSIENAFGSRLFVRGFFLNNQLTDFSFLPEAEGVKIANRVEPGKRPRSTMAPTPVFARDAEKTRRFRLALGSSGGPYIPAYVVKTLTGVLDFGLNIQEAMTLPNLANLNGPTVVEAGQMPTHLTQALQKRGHRVEIRDLNSGLHGVQADGSGLTGGADPRREGLALGDKP